MHREKQHQTMHTVVCFNNPATCRVAHDITIISVLMGCLVDMPRMKLAEALTDACMCFASSNISGCCAPAEQVTTQTRKHDSPQTFFSNIPNNVMFLVLFFVLSTAEEEFSRNELRIHGVKLEHDCQACSLCHAGSDAKLRKSGTFHRHCLCVLRAGRPAASLHSTI